MNVNFLLCEARVALEITGWFVCTGVASVVSVVDLMQHWTGMEEVRRAQEVAAL